MSQPQTDYTQKFNISAMRIKFAVSVPQDNLIIKQEFILDEDAYKELNTSPKFKNLSDRDLLLKTTELVARHECSALGNFESYNAEGLPHSEWSVRDKYGNLREHGFYENGLKEGSWKIYDKYGRISEMSDYKPWSTEKGNFKNNQREGLWETYNYYGDLKSHQEYKNGRKEGKYTRYEYGKTVEEGFYKNNQKHGKWTGFGGHDSFPYEGEYVDGSKQGLWKIHNTFTKTTEEGHYEKNRQNGLWKQYNTENGTVLAEENYKNGRKVGFSKYYSGNNETPVFIEFHNATNNNEYRFENPSTIQEITNAAKRIQARLNKNTIEFRGFEEPYR